MSSSVFLFFFYVSGSNKAKIRWLRFESVRSLWRPKNRFFGYLDYGRLDNASILTSHMMGVVKRTQADHFERFPTLIKTLRESVLGISHHKLWFFPPFLEFIFACLTLGWVRYFCGCSRQIVKISLNFPFKTLQSNQFWPSYGYISMVVWFKRNMRWLGLSWY